MLLWTEHFERSLQKDRIGSFVTPQEEFGAFIIRNCYSRSSPSLPSVNISISLSPSDIYLAGNSCVQSTVAIVVLDSFALKSGVIQLH